MAEGLLFLLRLIMITEIRQKILNGDYVNVEDILHIVRYYPLSEVIELAHQITLKFASNKFDMCSIINAKSGRCPENCKWCAQSVHYSTNIEEYGIVSEDVCVKHAAENERYGVSRFSLVTSGKKPNDRELDKICSIYRKIEENCNIKLCASLGLVNYQQLQKLHESGVERYHCNLETSPGMFGKLCSTHSQEQKIETIKAAQKCGMTVCSGGIIGMGESMEDRAEMALILRDLGILSIPINLLQPIKGTPLENTEKLSEEEILRTIALFRMINPKAYLRFAGGRSQICEEGVKQALYTGINSAIVGNLLTTIGSGIDEDIKRIKESGYEL